VGQSAATSSTSEVTSTATSTTFGVTRRPESLTAAVPPPRHGARPTPAGGDRDRDRYSMDAEDRRGYATETPRSRCLTLSDLHPRPSSSLAADQLGSQSTLASDRGAGGARLLHTSHDPLHYSSSQSAGATTAALGHHQQRGGDAPPGSPIWKRRQAGRGGPPTQSPASTDDGHADDHAATTAPAKQRVTFRIPPSAYIETEDTDC